MSHFKRQPVLIEPVETSNCQMFTRSHNDYQESNHQHNTASHFTVHLEALLQLEVAFVSLITPISRTLKRTVRGAWTSLNSYGSSNQHVNRPNNLQQTLRPLPCSKFPQRGMFLGPNRNESELMPGTNVTVVKAPMTKNYAVNDRQQIRQNSTLVKLETILNKSIVTLLRKRTLVYLAEAMRRLQMNRSLMIRQHTKTVEEDQNSLRIRRVSSNVLTANDSYQQMDLLQCENRELVQQIAYAQEEQRVFMQQMKTLLVKHEGILSNETGNNKPGKSKDNNGRRATNTIAYATSTERTRKKSTK